MISKRQKLYYSLISIPFLILFLVEILWTGSFFSSSSTSTGMSFLADLIFLNNIHIGFSFFLFYKVKEVRQTFEGANIYLLLLLTGLAVSLLMLFNLNEDLLGVLAILHAYLQSMGLFLLAFASAQNRKTLKKIFFGFLVAIIVVKKEILILSDGAAFSLGLVALLTFSYFSRSWLGALFSIRFFLWFSPTPLSGSAVAAIHGLEYLIVVSYLLKNQNLKVNLKDIPFLALIVSVLSYYTVKRYFFVSSLPLDFIFFFCVYSHYAFDSYAFRFQYAKQRKFILPLFYESRPEVLRSQTDASA